MNNIYLGREINNAFTPLEVNVIPLFYEPFFLHEDSSLLCMHFYVFYEIRIFIHRSQISQRDFH